MNQSLISRDKKYCAGRPRIRFHRITVSCIKGWYDSGYSIDNIIELYPQLNRNQVIGAVNYGKQKKINLK